MEKSDNQKVKGIVILQIRNNDKIYVDLPNFKENDYQIITEIASTGYKLYSGLS